MRMLLAGLLVAATAAAAETPDALSVARRAAEIEQAAHWQAEAVIELIDDRGSLRERRAAVANRLDEARGGMQRLYRFTAPPDIAGTALLVHENLRAEDDLWLYLPALQRVRRLVAGDRKNRFAGTEFAFVDLAAWRVADYQHRLLEADTDGRLRLESTARDAALAEQIGHLRQIAWIDPARYTTERIEYYDAAGRLLKVQTLADFRAAPDGRHWVAARRRMDNHQNGRATMIRFERIDFDRPPSAREFHPGQFGRD